jgi:hypothetical protein
MSVKHNFTISIFKTFLIFLIIGLLSCLLFGDRLVLLAQTLEYTENESLEETLEKKNKTRIERQNAYFTKPVAGTIVNSSLLKPHFFSTTRPLSQNFVCEGGVILVTNTNDSGAGSLREAIVRSNQELGCQKIEFQIESNFGTLIQQLVLSKTYTINLINPLPTFTDGVYINGTSQADYNLLLPKPVIEIDGTNVVGFNNECGQSGLCFNTDLPNMKSKVEALSIIGFNGNGISYGGSSVSNENSLIAVGNYIGLRADGITPKRNSNAGIVISNTSNNIIGGESVAERNVISGNGGDGIYLFSVNSSFIQGNFIGTNSAGTQDIGNSGSGIYLDLSYFITIGGLETTQRNVISGNGQTIEDGITLIGDNYGVNIRGNRIGTNFNASNVIGNAYSGIYITNNNNKLVNIGSCEGSRNIISGNGKISDVDQFGVITFNDESRIEGNMFGVNISGSALSRQRKDLYIGGNSNIIGGRGRCNNIFKQGVDNIENIGFGNKFLGNSGTNIPPTVELKRSQEGDIIEPGPLLLEAEIIDNSKINRVEFISAGQTIGTDESAPYRLELNNLEAGRLSIYAKAINSTGLSNNSNIIELDVLDKNYTVSSPQKGRQLKFNSVFTEFSGRIYQSHVESNGAISTRYSTDGESWSDYNLSGQTNEQISQVSFKNRLVQAHQGLNNQIFTRSTIDGENWSAWQNSGGTLSQVSMVVFKDRIIQSVRGTDNNLYTRSSSNGVDWTSWTKTIKVLENPVFAATSNRLFMSVRGVNNSIYLASSINGLSWDNFVTNGAALLKPSFVSSGSRIIQSVRGTDNNVYARIITDDSISNWIGLGNTLYETDSSFEGEIARVVYTSTSNNFETCNHYLVLGSDWSQCELSPAKGSRVEYRQFDNRLWTFYRSGDSRTAYRTSKSLDNGIWNYFEQAGIYGASSIEFKNKLIVNLVDTNLVSNIYLIS